MLVVADSSPLIALVNAELIDLLPAIFGDIVVPPQVITELHSPKRSEAIRLFMAQSPVWLKERSPLSLAAIPLLDEGEIAAISLARELNAELLLIDELEGRKAAAERHIPLTGTVGVLERAAAVGLGEVNDDFGRLKRTDFWISSALRDERLKIWQQQRGTG